jgi:uncharacterized membrane protein YphA (DoxX/SURF4 family)
MNIALWIVGGLMALMVAASGLMKLVRPIAEIQKMPWAAKMTANSIRLIGVAEVLGALGLVLPLATGIAPILTPIAALCLATLMIGAAVTHVQIKDPRSAAVTTIVIASLLVFVAVGRFAGLN